MAKYNITDKDDHIDSERYQWIEDCLDESQYRISNIGFIYDNYVVEFKDPRAETLYLLRWGNG